MSKHACECTQVGLVGFLHTFEATLIHVRFSRNSLSSQLPPAVLYKATKMLPITLLCFLLVVCCAVLRHVVVCCVMLCVSSRRLSTFQHRRATSAAGHAHYTRCDCDELLLVLNLFYCLTDRRVCLGNCRAPSNFLSMCVSHMLPTILRRAVSRRVVSTHNNNKTHVIGVCRVAPRVASIKQTWYAATRAA